MKTLEEALAESAALRAALQEALDDVNREDESSVLHGHGVDTTNVRRTLEKALAAVREAWVGVNEPHSSAEDFDRHNATLDRVLEVDTSNGEPLSLGEKLVSLETTLAALQADCVVRDISSRMCERGTKSCVVEHDAALNEMRAERDALMHALGCSPVEPTSKGVEVALYRGERNDQDSHLRTQVFHLKDILVEVIELADKEMHDNAQRLGNACVMTVALFWRERLEQAGVTLKWIHDTLKEKRQTKLEPKEEG